MLASRTIPGNAILAFIGCLGLSLMRGPADAVATSPDEDRAQRIRSLEEERLRKIKRLVRICAARGDIGAAMIHVERSRALDPTRPDLVDSVIGEMREAGCWEDLISVHEQLIQWRPDEARTHEGYIGSCCVRAIRARFGKGDDAQAVELIDAYVKRRPDRSETYAVCANILNQNNRPQMAKDILRRALAGEFQDDPTLLQILGQAHVRLEELGEAVTAFETALEHIPSRRHDERRVVIRDLVDAYDKAGELDVVAQRIAEMIPVGELNWESLSDFGGYIEALARTRNEEATDVLLPVLDHPDARLAAAVVWCLASGSRDDFFPLLGMRALESDRRQILEAGIRLSWQCPQSSEFRPRVYSRLRELFEGDDDELKLDASMPLAHTFGDKEATAYLTEQAQSSDSKRAAKALGLLGNARPRRAVASPALLEAVVPLTRSQDRAVRRAAVDALASYSGEEVVRHLVDAVAYSDEESFSTIRVSLVWCGRDEQMVSRLLQEALARAGQGKARDRIQGLLRDIEQRQERLRSAQ